VPAPYLSEYPGFPGPLARFAPSQHPEVLLRFADETLVQAELPARSPMPEFHDSEIYRSILESLPTGLCVVDRGKRIVLWSDGAERITGHLRHEVIGHCCVAEALLHCDQQDCEWCNEGCPLARAIKTSQPAEAIGFLRHKAGHEIPVRVRAVPVHNAHGSIIGAAETFEDDQRISGRDHRQNGMKFPAWIDEVTDVANHAMAQSRLREALATFAEAQVPFGILCFRLEGLEHFRASFGLEAASSLLRVVARTLEGALWRTDFVGRWSDDQFLVILNGCGEEALRSVRERVRRMLASDGIEWWGERRSLPVSIGQATVQADDTVESLIGRAQESLAAAWAGHARAAASGAASSGS
jgi:diguanylate cyclase (GGDEF)-like protein/PAS domain S-box-containing protein